MHLDDDEDLVYGEAVTMAGVRKRSEVERLLPRDSSRALSVARAIEHPWYRTQALSNVASFKSGEEALSILEEAFSAANEQIQINRKVTVASWPLRELTKINPHRAQQHLERLLSMASQEAHDLRRADALFAICEATYPVRELRALAVPPLAQTLLSGHGWRIQRLMRAAIMLIHRDSPKMADQLMQALPENRQKRKLQEALGNVRPA